MTTTRQVPKLQTQQGAALLRVALLGVVFLVSFGILYYILTATGQRHEVAGAVIAREIAGASTDRKARHFIKVRLDDGNIARATIAAELVAEAGRRVKLLAIRMPIFGANRYQFSTFEELPDSPTITP